MAARADRLRISTAVSVLAGMALLAGCGGGGELTDLGDDEPDGYTVTMPEGFVDAPPERFAAVERQIEVGAETFTEVDVAAIQLQELWEGEVGGQRIEIDIQTEDLPVDGIDLEEYDDLSQQTLENVPQIQFEGTEPYTEFDGEAGSVTDFRIPGARLGTVSIATTVRDGFAYNVEIAADSPALREEARPLLDATVASWSWDD